MLRCRNWIVILMFGFVSLSHAVEKGEDASWLGVQELKGKVSLVILTNPFAPQFRSQFQSFDPSPFQQSGRQMFIVVDKGMSSQMPSLSGSLQSTIRETAGIGNATFQHNIPAYPAYLVVDPQVKIFSIRVGAVNVQDLIRDMASVPLPVSERILLEMGESTLRLEYLDLPEVGEEPQLPEPREESGALFTLAIPKFIEGLYVDARGRLSRSLSVLGQGRHYRIKAVGQVTLGPAVVGKYVASDACFVFLADKGTPWGDLELPALSRTLLINNAGMTPREAYHPGHEYTQDMDGNGKEAEFKVADREYEDNGGHLLVNVEWLLDFRLVVVSSTQSQNVILETQKLAEEGKWAQAVDQLEKAKEVSRDDFAFWNFLGVLYLKLSESEVTEGNTVAETSHLGRALSAFRRALELNDNSVAVQNNLGVAYRKTGDQGLARDHLNKALSLQSSFPPASYNLALLEEESTLKPVQAEAPVPTPEGKTVLREPMGKK